MVPSFLPNIVLLCFVFIPLWQILVLITRTLYPLIMMTDLFLSTFNADHYYRYWDTRQANPVHIQQLPERCYALTVNYPLMIVGTADRNLVVFNLQNPQTEFKRIQSPLKYQTRCLAAFPDQQGFLVMLNYLHVLYSHSSIWIKYTYFLPFFTNKLFISLLWHHNLYLAKTNMYSFDLSSSSPRVSYSNFSTQPIP
jgi:hypothetical protein